MSKTLGAVDYTPTEIDAALTTLVYFGGNAARASEASGVPKSTLQYWKSGPHRDRYQELAEKEGPKLEQLAAQQARETILRAGDIEAQIFDVLHARLNEEEAPEPQREDFTSDHLFDLATERWLKRGSSKELSELAGTVQRISTAKGINGTKLLELTGRPTSIVEHREGNDILRSLGARIPGLVVEADATEIRENRALPPDIGSANAREAMPAPHSHGVEPRTDRSG